MANKALIATVFLLTAIRFQAHADEFSVEFRDGTIATVDVADSPVEWSTVSSAGVLSKKKVSLNQVKSLRLTKLPASEKLIEILGLIGQLESDDYWAREEAEEKLVVLGKRYRKILEQENVLVSADGKYRLRRVINSMGTSQTQSTVDLDRILFNNGEQLLGDAGLLNIKCTCRGQTLTLNRREIKRLYRPVAASLPLAKTGPVEVELFHDHTPFLKAGKVRLFEFEKDPDGRPFPDKGIVEVNEAWVDEGLVMASENPKGHVRISSYEFLSKDRPVGGLSICNSNIKNSTKSRFRGVMIIRFCQPGSRDAARGVHQFGCFLAKVNRSRDFLVQAYDAAGNLLGVCEANHESCTFCGIRSSVPIAKIRILSNPWVRELRIREKWRSTAADVDYAVDSIYMSQPVAIKSPTTKPHYVLDNGDFGLIRRAELLDDDRVKIWPNAASPGPFQVDLEDASCIAFAPSPKVGPRNRWMIRTTDGSHFVWDPASGKSPRINETISPDDIVAIWPASTPLRYPGKGDFEKGKQVVVFPGCRIVTNELSITKNQFSWRNGTQIEEDLYVEVEGRERVQNEKPDNVSPGRDKFTWNIRSLKQYETPSIWLKAPVSLPVTAGIVKLRTGEQIVYGNGGFELESSDAKQLVFQRGEDTITIPFREVTAVYPATKDGVQR